MTLVIIEFQNLRQRIHDAAIDGVFKLGAIRLIVELLGRRNAETDAAFHSFRNDIISSKPDAKFALWNFHRAPTGIVSPLA